ncbi:MAG: hypothetical protein JSW40_06745 [Candidatus Omnitrophota bacterium]|nr:MAG: hypothetical protein JSW40_06745 [Candidatus Omnitrophota bacterium]
MRVEVKKLDKLKRQIRVHVEAQEFGKERLTIYQELGKNLKVPGFRQGTAPVEVLEKYHSKLLQEEFLKRALSIYYRKALEEKGLIPAGLPRIYDVEIDKEKLSFSGEFEVRPAVDIQESDYKGIKINSKSVEVKEIEIEKILTNLKEEIKKVMNKDFSDEELARWAGYPNLKVCRQAIKGEIFVEKLHQRRQKIDNVIVQQLLKNIKVEVPKSDIEQAHRELVNREMYNLRRKGIAQNDIDKYKKDIEEKVKPIAQEHVKLSYIIDAIAQKENIKNESNLGTTVLGFILSHAQYEE